ncbi:MAG TPA: biotin/lipoyl-binding protein, partial [Pyrinomonadaceae bacterium]|nr:biotin/lipoyl-binding protein [Pyrinomonadaceae bacterium]
MTEKPKPQRRSRFRQWLPGLIFLVVLGVAGFLFWRIFLARSGPPQNVITLSGRIEGDVSTIAAKFSGRILEVRVREGDTVNAGDVIAVLDDEQIRARESQAQASVSDAEAKVEAARAQIAVLQEQVRQSELLTEQARTDAQGRVRQAESEVVAAEAELAKQEAAYRIAAFDRDAYTRLAATGAVSERKGKEASSTAEQQTAAVAAARKRVDSARGALLVAKASLTNPSIRASQAGANRKQI